MRKWLSRIIIREEGLALPAVLAMLALGSLLIVPSLNYASTHLKTGMMMKENMAGLYAADAGVEDALWILANDKPTSFPHSYQLTDINGLTVEVVIDEVTTIVGEEIGSAGGHEEWLLIDKIISYDGENEIYTYTMSLTNDGSGNMKILKILIIFPPDLDYEEGTTIGDITTDDPSELGNPDSGITLIWEMSIVSTPTINQGETVEHIFQLSGPPDIEGVEGHGFVEAHRTDIGTVWDNDSQPHSITAQAKDATNTVVATIRAGVWGGSQLEISCWQINPP